MVKIVSTSINMVCVSCRTFRRHVMLAEGIGALCSECVNKS